MRRRAVLQATAGTGLAGLLGVARGAAGSAPTSAAWPVPDREALGLPDSAVLRPLQGGPQAALALMRAVQYWPLLTAWTGWGPVRLQVSATPSGRERPAPSPSGDAQADAEALRRHRATLFRFLGGAVDLRPQFRQWQQAWSIEGGLPAGLGPGLLFLAADGRPIHRVHLGAPDRPVDPAVLQAHQAWLSDWAAGGAITRAEPESAERSVSPARPESRPALDVAGYRRAWLEMVDAHQFAQLLSETGLGREEALRLAPQGRAWQVPPAALAALYQGAAEAGLKLLSFVHVPGLTHIHTGRLRLDRQDGMPWQLQASDMRMSLDMQQLARVWVAHRAGLHSVDLFNAGGTLLLSLFAQRPPGAAQPLAWPQLLSGLERA